MVLSVVAGPADAAHLTLNYSSTTFPAAGSFVVYVVVRDAFDNVVNTTRCALRERKHTTSAVPDGGPPHGSVY